MSPYERVISDPETKESLKKSLRSYKKRINLMAEMKLMQQSIEMLPSFAEPVPLLVIKQNMKPLRFGSYSSIS